MRGIYIVFGLLIAQAAVAQQNFIDFSLQTKFYLAGSIYGLRAEKKAGPKNSYAAMIGYNVLYHRDLGVHEDERGGGPGISFGGRHYWGENYSSFFAGIMLDVYYNHVKFKDNIGSILETRGKHDVLVIQPLGEIGYLFNFKKSELRFGPYISFGWEINTTYFNVTSNNPNDVSNPVSGHGPMTIVGFTVGKICKSKK